MSPPPDEPGDLIAQVPNQPSPESVLDKFIAAAGGAQRLAALTSFTAKGTYMGFDDADKSPMEVFARASGERSTIVHTLLGDSTTTITPTAAWIAAPPTEKPVVLLILDITGQELDGVKFDASILFPGRIKQSLTKLCTGVPQVLENDREVIQVQGNTPSGGTVTLPCPMPRPGCSRGWCATTSRRSGSIVTRIDYLGGQRGGRWSQDSVQVDGELVERALTIRAHGHSAERADSRGALRQAGVIDDDDRELTMMLASSRPDSRPSCRRLARIIFGFLIFRHGMERCSVSRA